jgi:hypothetical protein
MMLQIPFKLKNICCVGWLRHFSGAAVCATVSQNSEGGTQTNARKKNVVIASAATNPIRK